MKQREVQDAENTTWSCVQALSGLDDDAAELAADRLEGADGTVPVVCTPRGGEQSVRVALPRDWEEGVSDDALRDAIAAARAER